MKYKVYIFLYITILLYFLEKSWMLKAVIALGTGYIIAIICCFVCVSVKCVKYLKFRYRQFRNQREVERMPEPIQLNLLS